MRRRSLIALLALLVAGAIFAPTVAFFVTDWLWFSSEGIGQLFTTPFVARVLIGFVVGAATALVVGLNGWLALRLTRDRPAVLRLNQFRAIDVSRILGRTLLPLVVFIGLVAGLAAGGAWQTVLEAFHRVPFGRTDPVFGRDLSYYFFSLPFLRLVIGILFALVITSALIALAIYAFKGLFAITQRSVAIDRRARAHLFTLLALFFVLTAARTYLVALPGLLYSTTGPFTGASFADVHARLPVLNVLAAVALVAAGLVLVGIFRRTLRFVGLTVGFYVVVSVLGGSAYPALLQRFVVVPNELVKEQEFIERNIAATRAAWGLDEVKERELHGETSLTAADLEANRPTLDNVRLWDRGPLLDTFGQLQEIRTYYDFVSIDDDRYTIDGAYRQTMLSARELNAASLPAQTFVNERLTFTHGFGVAVGPVNEVTKAGLPVLFVQDLPPKSSTDSLRVTRPEIYFGELASDYVFVNTQAREFNYPEGDENVFAHYEGDGGVVLDSLLRKALYAIRFGSVKVLLSNDIDAESRVLYYRNVAERVRKAAPFLDYDRDPYLVIRGDGALTWLVDAYTTSDAYPYAERVPGGVNYMRNAVKVAIDAYTGAMTFYVADPGDPIIQVYERIFPGVFRSLAEMPDDLRAHVRYPEDLFRWQTALYATYHMREAQIFYNKEDEWRVPVVPGSDRSDPMMRHLIMKLPGEDEAEFILMLPFTPRGKDNLASWMVARSDGEAYGDLIVYRFPKQKLVFGPRQVVNRINQDAEISKQISLWDQRGSQVIQGNLFVIPIEGSLLYVRPLYLRAEGGKIPELKRIIVVHENRIAMEETFDRALQVIFGDAPATGPTDEASLAPSATQLGEQAREHLDAAQAAARAGDWATYGRELDALEAILEQL